MTCNGGAFVGEMYAQRQMVRAMTCSPPTVDNPDNIVTLKYKLPHFFKALRADVPARIVAIGSSSTAGRGDDVVPYPARLEMYLRWEYQARFPPQFRLDVLNRGRGGEEAPEERQRFKADIFDLKPALVIWQVGTNAVFHNYDIKKVAEEIGQGLDQLSGQEFDVILLDSQYVTAMLRDDKADASEQMMSLIAAAADKAKVNLFRRWALMRHWHIHNGVALADMIDPDDKQDQLHQNDWSTMKFSRALFDTIKDVLTKMDLCSSLGS
jgi:hypothetical protein